VNGAAGGGGVRDRRSTCFIHPRPTHRPIYSRVTHTHVLRPHFLGERQGRIKSGLRQFLLMRSNFQG
jgi:hypothetical protein